MATRGKRRPAAKTARAKSGAKKAAPATKEPVGGPMSLAEAKAMVRAKRPKLAAKVAVADAGAAASPAAVGAERAKLEKERREEIARRIREYTEVMEIMKRQGARRPTPKGGATAKAASFAPLQVFAEGDSWFDYPGHPLGGGIIPRLQSLLGVPILNLAKAGDEVRYMLGVEERTLLSEHLSKGCPAGGPWDVLLFSGGGNDIVDNPMALWVKDWNPAVPPAQLIHQPRFDTALGLVRAGYEDLIAIRDSLSPTTHLVFHGYDFAIPDGRGICHLGPWLKPTFDLKGFPNRAAAQAVVKAMLQQFAAMLTSFAARPRVAFINGQGTLAPQASSWHNELHPARPGFQKFAQLFQAEIKKLFPGRVA